MVTADFKERTNEDVIGIINDFKEGNTECDLNELKGLLAEVTNRRLGQQYADAVSDLIHSKIAVSPSGKTKGRPRENAFVKEREKYPVLKFTSGLLKAIAWIAFTLSVALGCVIGYLYFLDRALIAVSMIFAGVAIGTICLLAFYASAENILIKLETEKHLRKICKGVE